MFADSKLQGITDDVKKVLGFVVGAILSFFPPRYRQGRALRMEAMAGGVFQGILALQLPDLPPSCSFRGSGPASSALHFLYLLRKAPNKPAPVIRHYKIDDVLNAG